MAKLRPELPNAHPSTPCMRNGTAYLLIYNAVKDAPGLVHGKTTIGREHCAIGWYFEQQPRTALEASLIDEVAAVNDSIPHRTMKQRRDLVLKWLYWRLKGLGFSLPGRPPKKIEAKS